MISRIRITCNACRGAITARVQIGHESTQDVSFPCPHCGTTITFSLDLRSPPQVGVKWGENVTEGADDDGIIVNIGAGFSVPAELVHQDLAFPSLFQPPPDPRYLDGIETGGGLVLIDSSVAAGTVPHVQDIWRTVKQALHFHLTNQNEHLAQKLDEFWGAPRGGAENFENMLNAFVLRYAEPCAEEWIDPLASTVVECRIKHEKEFFALAKHYITDLKRQRLENYAELFDDYFSAYSDFSQTLLYTKRKEGLPANVVATSVDFAKTKGLYGDAFEILGSHLDVVAAINNILCGRSFNIMQNMTLEKYRTINKANRTQCFSSNTALSWFVAEYDSTIRNASHHRSFKLNTTGTQIFYRSGGTGAEHTMTYAKYLYQCNRIVLQLMLLLSTELLLIHSAGYDLSS